jgi:hypothetical protein
MKFVQRVLLKKLPQLFCENANGPLDLLRKLHVSVAHGTKCRHASVGYQRLHHAVGVAVRCGQSRSFNLFVINRFTR